MLDFLIKQLVRDKWLCVCNMWFFIVYVFLYIYRIYRNSNPYFYYKNISNMIVTLVKR